MTDEQPKPTRELADPTDRRTHAVNQVCDDTSPSRRNAAGHVFNHEQMRLVHDTRMPNDVPVWKEDADGDPYPVIEAHICDNLMMRIFRDQWTSEIVSSTERLFDSGSRRMLLVDARVRVTVFDYNGKGKTQSHESVGTCAAQFDPSNLDDVERAYTIALQGAVSRARRNAIQLFGEVFGGLMTRDRHGHLDELRNARNAGPANRVTNADTTTNTRSNGHARTNSNQPASGTRQAPESKPARATRVGASPAGHDQSQKHTTKTHNFCRLHAGWCRVSTDLFPESLERELAKCNGHPSNLQYVLSNNESSIANLPESQAARCREIIARYQHDNADDLPPARADSHADATPPTALNGPSHLALAMASTPPRPHITTWPDALANSWTDETVLPDLPDPNDKRNEFLIELQVAIVAAPTENAINGLLQTHQTTITALPKDRRRNLNTLVEQRRRHLRGDA